MLVSDMVNSVRLVSDKAMDPGSRPERFGIPWTDNLSKLVRAVNVVPIRPVNMFGPSVRYFNALALESSLGMVPVIKLFPRLSSSSGELNNAMGIGPLKAFLPMLKVLSKDVPATFDILPLKLLLSKFNATSEDPTGGIVPKKELPLRFIAMIFDDAKSSGGIVPAIKF